MRAQSPKKKEKERKNNNKKKKKKRDSGLVKPKDMQQEEGCRLGQRICSKKNQHQGPRTLANIWESQGLCSDFQQKLLKNLAKPDIIFVTHDPSL